MHAIKVYAAPFLPIFQCRPLREREQASPSSVRFRSGRWRKTPYLPSSPAAADHTSAASAAGAAATTPAFRPDRPSSIVRPQPESCPFRFGVVSWDLSMGGTHCRHRRRQQVALLLQRGARLCLARAHGKYAPLRFTPLLAMTPWLAGAARAQQQHHHQQRSPRAPELHRRPDGDGGQQPQAARAGRSADRRSDRRGPEPN